MLERDGGDECAPSDEEIVEEDESEEGESDGESETAEKSLDAAVASLQIDNEQCDSASDESDLERPDNDVHHPFRDSAPQPRMHADDDQMSTATAQHRGIAPEEVRRRVKASLASRQKRTGGRNQTKGREKRRAQDAVKHRGDAGIW